MLLTGSINPAVGGGVGGVRVAGTTSPSATLTVASGATLNARSTTAPSIGIALGGNTAGVLNVNPGATVTTASELRLADANGGFRRNEYDGWHRQRRELV